MTYTRKSLVMVWLITLGLFVATGSGAVTGRWVLLVLLLALATPVLLLTSPRRQAVTAFSRERATTVSAERDALTLNVAHAEVSEWENEGGAGVAHVAGAAALAAAAR